MGIEIGGPIDTFIERNLSFDRETRSIDVSRNLRFIIEDFQKMKDKGAKFTFAFFKDNIKTCYGKLHTLFCYTVVPRLTNFLGPKIGS